MKVIKSFLFIAVIVLSACGSPSALSEANNKQHAETIKTQIEEQKFEIEFERAFPNQSYAFTQMTRNIDLARMGGSSSAAINLSGGSNYLKFNKDTVSANLPFFGQRYMGARLSGKNSIEFEGIPKDLTKDVTNKNTLIKFNIRDKVDSMESYKVSLEIYDNGNSNLRVLSTQRSVITYRGKMKVQKEKE